MGVQAHAVSPPKRQRTIPWANAGEGTSQGQWWQEHWSTQRGQWQRKEGQEREAKSTYWGIYKKGDHQLQLRVQVHSEGKPIPVGQEFLQRYDEAVKKSNEARAWNKAKADIRDAHIGTRHSCLHYLVCYDTSLWRLLCHGGLRHWCYYCLSAPRHVGTQQNVRFQLPSWWAWPWAALMHTWSQWRLTNAWADYLSTWSVVNLKVMWALACWASLMLILILMGLLILSLSPLAMNLMSLMPSDQDLRGEVRWPLPRRRMTVWPWTPWCYAWTPSLILVLTERRETTDEDDAERMSALVEASCAVMNDEWLCLTDESIRYWHWFIVENMTWHELAWTSTWAKKWRECPHDQDLVHEAWKFKPEMTLVDEDWVTWCPPDFFFPKLKMTIDHDSWDDRVDCAEVWWWCWWTMTNTMWETDICPVLVLGRIVLFLGGCRTPAQCWIKIVHPWVQKLIQYTGWGLEEGS